MAKKTYYIYIMCHIPTGVVYVGQHKLPIGKTPETDNYHGSGTKWKKIYKNNSAECVKKVVAIIESRREANRLEKMVIAKAREKFGCKCVNIRVGGQGNREGREARLAKAREIRRVKSHPRRTRSKALPRRRVRGSKPLPCSSSRIKLMGISDKEREKMRTACYREKQKELMLIQEALKRQ